MHGRRPLVMCVFWSLVGVAAFAHFEGSLLRGLLVFCGVVAVGLGVSLARGWWTRRRTGSRPPTGV